MRCKCGAWQRDSKLGVFQISDCTCNSNMILKAYNKSEIARLYFQKKGEFLTNQVAANRWRMITPDKAILKEVFKEVHKKQLEQLKS